MYLGSGIIYLMILIGSVYSYHYHLEKEKNEQNGNLISDNDENDFDSIQRPQQRAPIPNLYSSTLPTNEYAAAATQHNNAKINLQKTEKNQSNSYDNSGMIESKQSTNKQTNSRNEDILISPSGSVKHTHQNNSSSKSNNIRIALDDHYVGADSSPSPSNLKSSSTPDLFEL
eukprot:g886.t1